MDKLKPLEVRTLEVLISHADSILVLKIWNTQMHAADENEFKELCYILTCQSVQSSALFRMWYDSYLYVDIIFPVIYHKKPKGMVHKAILVNNSLLNLK